MAKAPVETNSRYMVEQHREGRKLYGGFVQFHDGRKCYLAYRSQNEIFMSDRKNLSQALKEHVAYWCIDLTTLGNVERRGIEFIGVVDRLSKDIYLTRTSTFFDTTTSEIHNYAGRGGGTLQRRVNLDWFKVRRGRTKL